MGKTHTHTQTLKHTGSIHTQNTLNNNGRTQTNESTEEEEEEIFIIIFFHLSWLKKFQRMINVSYF